MEKVVSNCLSCGRFAEINEQQICFWCGNKRKLSAKTATKRNGNSAFTAVGKARFVTGSQLHRDTLKLVQLIPPDVVAVVGVARSGMVVATMVSMLLHRPLFAIRQTLGDVISVGNGWRLGGEKHLEPMRGKVVVVDDTVMTGNSLKAIKHVLADRFPDHITASVYVNPFAARKPDLHAVDLHWPHLLEWNLFNSVLSPNMACDFDGILCSDCQPGQDDDGDRYLDFIANAKPLYMPRKVPIPLIITARIEKYRQPTVEWLHRHGIKVHRLVMHPASTLAERNSDDVAAWKAREFVRWNNDHKPTPPPNAFIESDDRQARRINEISGLMTICPASAMVYQRGQ